MWGCAMQSIRVSQGRAGKLSNTILTIEDIVMDDYHQIKVGG
jgi:hypothetical protein